MVAVGRPLISDQAGLLMSAVVARSSPVMDESRPVQSEDPPGQLL
jgi:hypothetical protein